MSSYASTMTVLNPNTSGMPASGRALLGARACAPAHASLLGGADVAALVPGAWTESIAAATTVIRERRTDAAVKAAAKGHFPGTPAWRPPSC